MKNKLFLILFLTISLLMHSDELQNKYLQDAKNLLIIKDYYKAYQRINFVLKSYTQFEEIPFDISVLSEKIYYGYLNDLKQNNDTATIDKILEDPNYQKLAKQSVRLLDFKLIRDSEIKLEKQKEQEERFKRELEKFKEEQKIKDTELSKEKMMEFEKFFNIQEKMTKEKLDIEIKTKEQLNKILETSLITKDKEQKSTTKNIIFIVAIISSVFIILFLLFFFIIMIFIKNSHKQQKYILEYSMKALQPLTTIAMNHPTFGLPYSDNQLQLITGEENQKSLLPPQSDIALKVKNILKACTEYAGKIDEHTSRKNSSKITAELVFKISKHLGFDEINCMLHYSVALIHDIGFLELDGELFKFPELTEDEYETIKTHTTVGLIMIDFIEEEFKPIFKDGISKHHENLDGTGYPRGLFTEQIPYIARVIRIVESYIALISSRAYKKIKDKDTALADLYSSKSKYDEKIIYALENFI